MKIPDFKIGNVVKSVHGYLVIISGITNKHVHWISFDHSNSSGISKLLPYIEKAQCFCNENNNNEYDDECSDCGGWGEYNVNKKGFCESKILADNVKEYIMNSITKNFDF